MKFLMGIAIAGTSATVALLATATPTTAQTPAAAPPAFNACKACHTVNKGGRNGIGTNLNGVVGRPAASVAGFNYSPAMKASKLRWDARTLDEYLAGPTKKVPGTRMPIATPDAAKRAAIIAYLTSAK